MDKEKRAAEKVRGARLMREKKYPPEEIKKGGPAEKNPPSGGKKQWPLAILKVIGGLFVALLYFPFSVITSVLGGCLCLCYFIVESTIAAFLAIWQS